MKKVLKETETPKILNEFEDVRQWGKMRGIQSADFQVQYQRCMQEILEIHKAYIEGDMDEFQDAIGDSIVTLINVAVTCNYNAEDCLEKAFNVIKLRKGLNKGGSFVRYLKLTDEEKAICDIKQGNPGNQYFLEENLYKLSPEDFLG